ncbi:MAG: hypothetical protein JNN05_00585 [Candidatus Omnitrophica bacterium]|nr:hypothetical protein [Candidatus Omnitrophota bacterium]
MKRYFVFLLLSIAFFLGAVTYYINTVIIHKRLKNVIIEESQKFLGRRVQVADIHFNPIQGIIFNGVSIFENGSPDPFIQMAHARVRLLLWPLLREGKIVLSSINIDTTQINFIHYGDGEWNFTDILKHRATAASSKKLNLFLSKLNITNSHVKMTSLENGLQFSDDFNDVTISLGLSVTQGITFHFSSLLNDQPEAFYIGGNYQPLTQKVSAEINLSKFNPLNYYRLFKMQLPWTIDDLFINEARLKIIFDQPITRLEGRVLLDRLGAHKDTQSVKTDHLSLEGIDLQVNAGQTALKANAVLNNFLVSWNGSRYQTEILTAQIAEWRSQNEHIDTTGSLNAQHVDISTAELTARGDVLLKNWRISQDAQNLNMEGAAELTKTIVKSATVEATGDFLVPSFSIKRSQGITHAQGNLVAANLNYRWPSRELSGNIALTDWHLTGPEDGKWTSKSTIQGLGLQIKLPAAKSFKGDVTGTGTLQFEPESQKFEVKSDFQITQGLLTLSEKLSLTASPTAALTVSSKPDPSGPVPYSGKLKFTDGLLQGTFLGPIENISGIISFHNDKLETQLLNFTALGMPSHITGSVENFSSPLLDVHTHTQDFDLSTAQRIIPSIITKNKLTIMGNAKTLDVDYRGDLSSAQTANIGFSAKIQQGSVSSSTTKKSLSGLSGILGYKNKVLSWKNMNARFEDKSYITTGELMTGDPTVIDTTIEGEDLKLHTRFTPTANTIRFDQLSGRYKSAFLNVQGTYTTTVDGHPFVDFTGDADLDLKDLPVLLTGLPDPIKECRFAGKTSIKGHFSGDLKHWQDWKYNLTGSSPEFSTWGVNFNNINFNAVQKDNLLKPFHVWGDFYGGEFNLVASLDTSKKELPLDLVVRILNSDLKKFSQDTPFRKQPISGTLSSTGIFQGQLTDLKLLNGKGGIEITDWLLWEIDLLRGLGGILLIPEYKDIVFTQAGMNFVLESGMMRSENIQLVGPSLELYGKGSLDFNQNQELNLFLTPDFNSDVIVKSSSLKKGTTAIITQTGKFMSVQVTGTLTKPQYKVNKSPVKILQKTGGVILENVSQFFQNIF